MQSSELAKLLEALELVERHGSVKEAAIAAGVPRTTMSSRYHAAKAAGLKIGDAPKDERDAEIETLRERIKTLESMLRVQRRDTVSDEYIKRYVLKLAESPVEQPKWTIRPGKFGEPGVPVTIWSDWHWSEVVRPEQVNGVNEFNLDIAHARLKRLVSGTIELMSTYTVHREPFPGIVVCLAGDMISGDIHEELSQTNERPVMPTLIDLIGKLQWAISTLADHFGRVFLPCVVGNHGRTSRRPRFADRTWTNYDWLTYQFLAKLFENDSRVRFMIGDGADVLFSVYGHRYLLTHGDALGRGGDGIIGHIGNVIRGAHRRALRNQAVQQEFDTLLCHPAGTQIICADRIKPIEEVRVGDIVLTHLGNWKPVVMARASEGETIEIDSQHAPSMRITTDHELWARPMLRSGRFYTFSDEAPRWVPAADSAGHAIMSPTLFPALPIPAFRDPTGRERQPPTMTDEFWYLVGLWLGNGWATKGMIHVSSHIDDLPAVRKTFMSLFGTATPGRRAEKCETTIAGSAVVADWLTEHFGSGASGKTIPGWLLGADEHIRRAVLRGLLDTDGHYEERNRRWEYKTVSKALAVGVKMLAQSLGFVTALSVDRRSPAGVIQGRRVAQRDVWRLFIRDGYVRHGGARLIDGGLWARSKPKHDSIRKERVYQLGVLDDGSYIADGIAVKNCGHFHQCTVTSRFIVNGSLVGPGAFSHTLSFPYEKPQQALWLNHPSKGITISMPVFLEDGNPYKGQAGEWVSWNK